MCRMVRKWEFISILTDNCSAHLMPSHAARIHQLSSGLITVISRIYKHPCQCSDDASFFVDRMRLVSRA